MTIRERTENKKTWTLFYFVLWMTIRLFLFMVCISYMEFLLLCMSNRHLYRMSFVEGILYFDVNKKLIIKKKEATMSDEDTFILTEL